MVGSLWYKLNSVKTAVHELGTEETEISEKAGTVFYSADSRCCLTSSDGTILHIKWGR
jgi:hypothetical protein